MLSTTALHAVRALGELSKLSDDQYAGAVAIAKKIGAPPNYLGKLLQSLIHEGIVDSRKGAGGGFRLARRAETITLFEVVESIDRVSRWNGCFLQNPRCGMHGGCTIHKRWSPIRDAYLKLLRESTVDEVVNNGFPLKGGES
jgi:Rrf2 family transcriptional regulator, iron-sulfur cluster assembly transcription factor